MNLLTYTDARDYLNDSGGFLMEHEAENCLILSLALRLAMRSEALPPDSYMVAAAEDGRVVAAAAMTSPFRLMLTSAPDAALELIGSDLRSRGLAPSGILAPKPEAALFAKLWENATGGRATLLREERIYQLDRVLPPSGVPGTMRLGTDDDFEMALEWGRGFSSDVGIDVPRERMEAVFRSSIAEQRLVIWEDGAPVCTATWLGPTPNGARIGGVYTPPAYRGRGYASACVASLSQYLLDAGRRFCCLFTDLANPTSNSIYQKIGYRPVADCDDYVFHR